MHINKLALVLMSALLLASCGTTPETSNSGENSSGSNPNSGESTGGNSETSDPASTPEPEVEWTEISEEEFATWATEKNEAAYADVETFSLETAMSYSFSKGETNLLRIESIATYKFDLDPDNAYGSITMIIKQGDEEYSQITEVAKNEAGEYVSTTYTGGTTSTSEASYEQIQSQAASMFMMMSAYTSYTQYSSSETEQFEGFYKSSDGNQYKVDMVDQTLVSNASFEDTTVSPSSNVKGTITAHDVAYIFDKTGLTVGLEIGSYSATFDPDGAYSGECSQTADGEVNGVIDRTSPIPA